MSISDPLTLIIISVALLNFILLYKEVRPLLPKYLIIALVGSGIFLLVQILTIEYLNLIAFTSDFIHHYLVFPIFVLVAPLGEYYTNKINKPIGLSIKKIIPLSVFSAILLLLTFISITEIFSFEVDKVGFTISLLPFFILEIFLFVVFEESIIRMYLQPFLLNYLKNIKFSLAISVLIASTIWTLSHSINPSTETIKFLNIFFAGILLGFLSFYKGWEAALLSHFLYNFIVTFIE